MGRIGAMRSVCSPAALLAVPVALAAFSLAPSSAEAQHEDWETIEDTGAADEDVGTERVPLRPVVLDPYPGELRLEAAFFTRDVDGTQTSLVSPFAEADYRFHEHAEMVVQMGAAWAKIDEESAARPGNLLLGGRFVQELGTYPWLFEVKAGLEVALPTALLDEDDDFVDNALRLAAWGGASSMRGSRDAWLWTPDRLSLVVPVAFVSRHSALHLEASLDVGTLISIEGEDPEVAVQFLIEGGWRIAETFLLAAAFSGSAVPTADGDTFQSALSLLADLALGEGAGIYARLWMNLDDPNGFAFDDDGIWGMTGGVRFGLP